MPTEPSRTCENCGGLGRRPRGGCFGPVFDPFARRCSVCGGTGQAPDPHAWALVSEEDPNETEVCSRCGAQRDRNGPIEKRAFITGGWPSPDCEEIALIRSAE